MLFRFILILFILMVMSACTLNPDKIDPDTGYLPEWHKLDKDEVTIQHLIKLNKYKRLLVIDVQNTATDDNKEALLWKDEINSFGLFEHVELIENVKNFMLQQGYKVPANISQLSDLQKVQTSYGDFLVVQIYDYCLPAECFIAFKVVDPATRDVLYSVKTKFQGALKRRLINPVINQFIRSLKKNYN